MLLASLKDLVSSGEHRLDRMLAAVADAARRMTGASGSAIAMWKDGAMVCRARSGETAPALGAQLNAQTGISGECLRTGVVQHCPDTEQNPLVDVEVCRNLGLRSIVVLPIHGWLGVNGILEVFGTVPRAFSEHQVALLRELAAIAERARAARPLGASQLAASEPHEEPKRSGLLPASDRLRDLALAIIGGRSRRLVLGTVGVAALVLIALAIWLGWRGAEPSDSKAHAASPSSVAAAGTTHPGQPHLPDNDPVWKPNPGGETLFSSNSKPSAGSAVKFASKTDVIDVKVGGKKLEGVQPILNAAAPGVAVPHPAIQAAAGSAPNSTAVPPAEETTSIEAPPISAGETGSSTLNEVLSASVSVPQLSAPVSQGVSGGRIQHQVLPVYPAKAQTMRLEGKVVVDVMVREDGTVGDLKVLEGHPMLAEAVLDAVKNWRYEPFLLNGRPTKRETKVTINFRLPVPR
ncbi:MAG: TonB family protein [Terriglobales bacterium]